MPKVSVVIPAFNAASSIGRTLNSLMRQSRDDFEIIVVDDRSTDETMEIVSQHILALQGKLRVYPQPDNYGPAAARNMGWSLARADYVAFLDADDAWHEDKLKRQLAIMEDGADISGHRTPLIHSEIRLSETLPRAVTARNLRRLDVLLKNPFNTSSVIVRRDLPLRFSEQLRCTEDYLLWCEIVMGGYRSVALDPPLAFVFKPFYGHSGLSADLRAMQQGELTVYDRLYEARELSRAACLGLKAWSCIRYWRRCLISRLRTHQCHDR
ncbi:glycosyltransferase family 2 protein [Ochrobactrum sp. LMG 5442]|nr:glycosyltransferase family 2 protein [Ochrobactrum sp. LMG 5442]